VQASRVLEAAELLAAAGIEAQVVHLPTLKPLEDARVLAALEGAPIVVSVEEHTEIGGLGGLLAELFARHDVSTPLRVLGLADAWSESAPNDFLLDKYGLSPERVAERVRALL
jgi:transketolase